MRKLDLTPEERLERKRFLDRAAHHRRKDNPDYKGKRKLYAIRHKYGLSPEQYNQMFADQNGRCAICERHQSEFKKGLYVDHCHKSGKVRKLLCVTCNNFLGAINDDPNKSDKIRDYLSWE